jgi:MoaA/NifB/PqqE/SkfB family radical SAM enzyme
MLAESEQEWSELKQRFFDIRSQAASLDTDIHFHIVAPFSKRTMCSENISRALVIGSDGSVSPCVMKNLPVNGKIDYYFNKQKINYQPLTFGNIRHDPLNVIWHSHSYRHFRKKSFQYLLKPCEKCYKQFIDSITPPGSYWDSLSRLTE